MYIVNGIAYAGEPTQPIRVKAVKVIDNLCLLLTFSTNEKRIYDAEGLLQYPAYKRLENFEIFKQACVECGTVVWCDGEIDIASETLYRDSFVYEEYNA